MTNDVLQLRQDMIHDAMHPNTKPPMVLLPEEQLEEEEEEGHHHFHQEEDFHSPTAPTAPTAPTSPTSPASAQEESIRTKLRAASYGTGGTNWEKLFKHYDRDNSGSLDSEEFRRAIRKDGKMSKGKLSDQGKFYFRHSQCANTLIDLWTGEINFFLYYIRRSFFVSEN